MGSDWGRIAAAMTVFVALSGVPSASAIESPTERSRQILSQEAVLSEGLDELDREIMGLVADEMRLERRRSESLAAVKQADEQVASAQDRIASLNELLKQRLRARANLRLDERAWRRLVMASEGPTEMIRRRGYLRSVLRYDLELLKRLKSDSIVLEALRNERLEAVGAVRGLEIALAGKRERLENSRQAKSQVLQEVRRKSKWVKAVLDDRSRQRDALVLDGGDPGEGFAPERGILPTPLKGGTLASAFGIQRDPLLKTRTESRGWRIKAAARTPVRAVYGGRVAFSGWYRGFGNLVILDHGGDHYSLYAHLHSITQKKNARIQQGGMVGDVGETGSLSGPQLYFELRAGRQPVDPAQWILNGVP